MQVAFEFKPKQRDTKEPEKTVKAMNTKKHQKQFYELQTKRDYEKMRAMLNKSFDPNFHYDQNGSCVRLLCLVRHCHGVFLTLPSS